MAADPTSVEATALRMLAGLRRLVEDRRPADVIIEAIDAIADTIDPLHNFRSQDVDDEDEGDGFTIDLTTDPVSISTQGAVAIEAVLVAPGVAVERICQTCRHWRPGPNVDAKGERSGTCVCPTHHATPTGARDNCESWTLTRTPDQHCETCQHWRRAGKFSGVCSFHKPTIGSAPGDSCPNWKQRGKQTCQGCVHWGPLTKIGKCPERAFTINQPDGIDCANWKHARVRSCFDCAHNRPAPASAPGPILCDRDSLARDLTQCEQGCDHWTNRKRCQTCQHWRHEGDDANGTCVGPNPDLKTAPNFSCPIWVGRLG